MGSIESQFMMKNVPRLLSRYNISYYREDTCVEYFITEKDKEEAISYSLVLSLNRTSRQIHVSRFYPELHKQMEPKYLSAACFYLLVHHFGEMYHLGKEYSIHLQTRPATYKKFFSKLRDFDLRHNGLKLVETVDVLGHYPPLDIDTSMIERKIAETREVPFQV